MRNNNFVKVATIAPKLEVGKPMYNIEQFLEEIDKIKNDNPHFIVFPELAVTGYTCGDLFFQSYLIEENNKAIRHLLKHNTFKGIIIFGALYIYKNDIFNCAYVIQENNVLGIIPKMYLPNRDEFYETRYFAHGTVLNNQVIYVEDFDTTFGSQLFHEKSKDIKFGIEVCEDMWAPIPPASYQTISGAEIIFNVSASNEVLDKDEVRRYMIKSFSKRNNCAYVYASSGRYESSQDTVFSNHCLILENGKIKAETKLLNNDSTVLLGDIDLGFLKYLKRKNATNRESLRIYINNFSTVNTNCNFDDSNYQFIKPFSKTPFIPTTNHESAFRKILAIQVAGLAKRITHINAETVLLGLSGGLDSTLAFLVLNKTFEYLNRDKKGIKTITMPGLGTGDRTLNNAINLAKALNIECERIDIKNSVLEQFNMMHHNAKTTDITYENTQARTRTSLLFNKANQLNGFVLGTGDMSELALGWCTYNGDHMSNYSINSGLPKTLIKFMVQCFALYEHKDNELLYKTLLDILETPISPELTGLDQKTEAIIGKYEINDFILYRMLFCGDDEKRIDYLLEKTFEDQLTKDDRQKYIKTFYQRFFSQQFKRSTLPDGPKILDISLSPRSDWRMPSDAKY
ncbi:NAD(+) synthase [Mycoplasmatota bacterium]|nr:NAD(+) synthase [Mycoplasmatota bacterium]